MPDNEQQALDDEIDGLIEEIAVLQAKLRKLQSERVQADRTVLWEFLPTCRWEWRPDFGSDCQTYDNSVRLVTVTSLPEGVRDGLDMVLVGEGENLEGVPGVYLLEGHGTLTLVFAGPRTMRHWVRQWGLTVDWRLLLGWQDRLHEIAMQVPISSFP